MTSPDTDLRLTAAQAAEVLGVRRETLYAYVSRGLLTRWSVPGRTGGRRSLFDRQEVEELAARNRHQDRAGHLDIRLDSELTLLDPDGRLAYRGRDAAGLVAAGWELEQVADLLWDDADPAAWQDVPSVAGQVDLPPALERGGVLDLLQIVIRGVAVSDADRGDVTREHVVLAGRRLLRSVAVVLGADPAPETVTDGVASWVTSGDGCTPQVRDIVRAALVLMADHELAASTLAARIAASTRADPYAAVTAGLAAIGGPLHGTAGMAALELLDTAVAAGGPLAGRHPPGFGHRVYRGVDPRAEVLLDRIAALDLPGWAQVDAVLQETSRRTGLEPNVDFALAALTFVAGLCDETPLALFAIARIVGLLAHAMDEYRFPLRFRPRAVYTGPPIG